MAEEASTITFAIISSAPAASALLQSVCDELKTVTSTPIEAKVLRSYDKLVDAMRAGEVHVAWAPPLVALDLERDGAAKIRLCSRRAGKRDYASAVFVKKDASANRIADLAGKRMAWVAKESSAGYVVPRLRMLADGLDPDAAFTEQTYRRTHEAVARAVLSGDADAGATYVSFVDGQDTPISAGWFEAGAKNDDVRILATAGPIPTDVIAVSTKLPEDQARQLTTALQSLGDSIRQLLNADGFDEPEHTHFDELRKLVERVGQAR